MDLLESIKTALGIMLGFFRNNPILILIFVFLFGQLFFVFKEKSSESMFSKHYLNMIITAIPIMIIIMVMFNINTSLFDTNADSTEKAFSALKILGGVILIIGIIYGAWYINAPHKSPSGKTIDPIINDDIAKQIMFFINIIGVGILLFGLIIFGRTLRTVAYSVKGWFGIILRIIFFIPCMLSDLFNYIVGEFSRSPFVVYVLLAIEALLIIAYFYLPTLLAKFSSKSGYKLISTPVSLENKTHVISLANLYEKQGTQLRPGHKRLYSISMWFYINSMPTSQYPYNTDAIIFALADASITDKPSGHPQIMYNGAKNKCVVIYDNKYEIGMTPPPPAELKIPLQKWVHFAMVYDSRHIDMFVNGKLEKTVPRLWNVRISATDTITVGQENGLQGKICNVMHYGRPLMKKEIVSLYELNKDSDPPLEK